MTSIRKVRKKAIRKMGFRMSFLFSHKDPNQKLIKPVSTKENQAGSHRISKKKCL